MEDQSLCANGCGFFGTTANQNLCSKCYKDFLKKEEENSEKEKAENSEKEKAENSEKEKAENSEKEKAAKAMAKDMSQLSLSSEKKTIVVTDHDSSTKKKNDRCGKCNKKAGIVGFKCRCGTLFCSIHRLPEKHDCNFDYKAMGREILIKENPLINADKLKGR